SDATTNSISRYYSAATTSGTAATNITNRHCSCNNYYHGSNNRLLCAFARNAPSTGNDCHTIAAKNINDTAKLYRRGNGYNYRATAADTTSDATTNSISRYYSTTNTTSNTTKLYRSGSDNHHYSASATGATGNVATNTNGNSGSCNNRRSYSRAAIHTRAEAILAIPFT
ncbi:MAG: hypothetical protein ACRCWC_13535, partial [Plesiomonas shigelloides]